MTIKIDSEGNPILNQSKEEGFVDLTFRIGSLIDEGGNYRFHLAASYNGNVVGMNVVLVKEIQGGIDAKMRLIKDHVYRSGVRFERSGPESDLLISAIAEQYGALERPKKMVDFETFTTIALHQGKLDMDRQPVKLKIFGRDAEPLQGEAYYESYFNVDLLNRYVFWNEKDPAYRAPLLRALGKN